jgi:hypothetical protein
MAKVSEVYSGNYVQASELPKGQRVTAVIVAAEAENIGQDQQLKIVLTLRHQDGRAWPRRVVCNKTNGLILSAALGDDTIHWPGRTVQLWSEPVTFQGRLTQGIRMLPLAPPPGNSGAIPMPPPVAATAPHSRSVFDDGVATADHLDDEIPY